MAVEAYSPEVFESSNEKLLQQLAELGLQIEEEYVMMDPKPARWQSPEQRRDVGEKVYHNSKVVIVGPTQGSKRERVTRESDYLDLHKADVKGLAQRLATKRAVEKELHARVTPWPRDQILIYDERGRLTGVIEADPSSSRRIRHYRFSGFDQVSVEEFTFKPQELLTD